MIIFLYGPDDYRRLQRKKDLVAAFRQKYSSLGFESFDGEAAGASPDALHEFTAGSSLFEKEKLVVLENAFAMDAAKLAPELKGLVAASGTTMLISEREKPPKQLAFLLKAPVRAEKFEALNAAEMSAFARAEAKKLGMSLSPDAARSLGAVYKGNSWALATELQKLASLVFGGSKRPGTVSGAVDKKALDTLGLEAAPDYWPLLNGLKSFDGRIRLAALEKLFALNDPPPKIFNILAAQAGEKAPRMAEFDLAVKSGKLDYEEALLDIVLSP